MSWEGQILDLAFSSVLVHLNIKSTNLVLTFISLVSIKMHCTIWHHSYIKANLWKRKLKSAIYHFDNVLDTCYRFSPIIVFDSFINQNLMIHIRVTLTTIFMLCLMCHYPLVLMVSRYFTRTRHIGSKWDFYGHSDLVTLWTRDLEVEWITILVDKNAPTCSQLVKFNYLQCHISHLLPSVIIWWGGSL